MDRSESRFRRPDDRSARLAPFRRHTDTFDWDSAYLAAVDDLKRKKRKF